MTLTEISALNLDTAFFDVLNRMVDWSLVPVGESRYTDSEVLIDSMYDRITLNIAITKPTLAAMDAELIVYKAELTATENARLAEMARLNDINSRWKVLKDRDAGMPSFRQTVAGQPNPEAYLRDLILAEPNPTLAESRLAAIESADAIQVQQIADNAWLEGRKRRYREEADPIFVEALRERELGNSIKWTAYLALITSIKTEFPKPV